MTVSQAKIKPRSDGGYRPGSQVRVPRLKHLHEIKEKFPFLNKILIFLGKISDAASGIALPETAGDIEFSILRYKIPDIPPRADARELVTVMVPGLIENKGLDSGLTQMNTGFGAVINKEL